MGGLPHKISSLISPVCNTSLTYQLYFSKNNINSIIYFSKNVYSVSRLVFLKHYLLWINHHSLALEYQQLFITFYVTYVHSIQTFLYSLYMDPPNSYHHPAILGALCFILFIITRHSFPQKKESKSTTNTRFSLQLLTSHFQPYVHAFFSLYLYLLRIAEHVFALFSFKFKFMCLLLPEQLHACFFNFRMQVPSIPYPPMLSYYLAPPPTFFFQKSQLSHHNFE